MGQVDRSGFMQIISLNPNHSPMKQAPSYPLFLLISRLQKSSLGPRSYSSSPDAFDFGLPCLTASRSVKGASTWGSFRVPVNL